MRAFFPLGLLVCAVPAFVFGQVTETTPAASGQQPAASQAPTPGGGQATGSPHAIQLDAQHRPITAGGFVKSGPVVFEDASEKAGLTHWTHTMGTPDKHYLVETKGSGVCLLDYDHDGWLDIYVVNGSTFDALDGKAAPPHAALFHNNHDGTFTEVA
ncbi:MAG: VCBS repeat-containing protein, partial [Terracidiphilus sp.]